MIRRTSALLLTFSALGACAQDEAPERVRDEVSAVCPADVLCRGELLYRSRIGLWYALWWREGAGGHWSEWSRYRPTIGYYTSGGARTFGAERAAFERMAIDYLLLDHTNGLGADGGALRDNGRAVIAALEGGAAGLSQAVAFGGCLWAEGVADRDACARAEADEIWRDFADPSRHPSALRLGAAPLLVAYTAPGLSDGWADPRFEVGAATGRTLEASPVMRRRGLFGWVFDDPTPIHGRVMGVTPGWDTAHLGRGTEPIDREANGMRFQRQWLRAIAEDPETIVISSWNDFAEETAIQPAERSDPSAPRWADAYGNECPNFYADIVRVYSKLRWGLAHGAYVKDVARSEVYLVTPNGLEYQTQMPTRRAARGRDRPLLDRRPGVRGQPGGGLRHRTRHGLRRLLLARL